MRRRVLSLALLVSCAAGPAEPGTAATDDGPQRYEADATVLQVDDQTARLCLGAVLDSLPPQCGDVPIVDWDWEEVLGEDHAGGVTWGDYHVEGTYDGASFTVTSVGPRSPGASNEEDPFATPCTEPAGGWISPNPSMTSESDRTRAMRAAEDQADFAGSWIDYLAADPAPEDPGPYVLNVAFTGDVAAHETELRPLWGGSLCVVRFDRTEDELRRIQEELEGPEVEEFGLRVLWSATNVMRNQVEIGVVTSSRETVAAFALPMAPGPSVRQPRFGPSRSPERRLPRRGKVHLPNAADERLAAAGWTAVGRTAVGIERHDAPPFHR